MEHELALQKITEWAQGRLEGEEAAAVEAHVRACEECRQAAEVARGVRAAVAEHGEHLFSPHPEPDRLARYALDPDGLPVHELAAFSGHVAACPVCAHELALVRAASAPSLVRALRAWLPGPPPAVRLQWAFAILAVALVVPAYLGLVELPRERARMRLESRLAPAAPGAAVAPATPAAPWTGGGVDLIVLSGPTRGAAALPEVRLRAGQPAQPILVDAALPASDSLAIRLMAPGGRIAWSATVAQAAVWDAGHHLASLLVPAAGLAPGEYRLEIAPAGAAPGGPPAFTGRFRVRAGAAP